MINKTQALDVSATIALLEEIIEAAGEGASSPECRYVVSYTAPNYVRGKVTPQCIVGQITHKVGGEAALMKLEEFANADGPSNSPVLRRLGFTQEAIEFLQRLQVEQDKRIPWTDALDEVRPPNDAEENV